MSTAATRASREPYREAVYDPFEDDLGESSLQRFISELFRPLVEEHLASLRGPTFVGADQYVGWDPDDPEKVLSPDVYVLPGVEPGEEFDFWKVWQTGIVPSFALEIVSKRKKKDYTTVPPLYGDLGVEELIIFDPRYRRRREGLRFQVYRKVARRGFVRVEATNADRVRSRVLGAWIRVVGEGKAQRLRLATNPSGDALLPTAKEQAAAGLVEAVLTLYGARFGAVPSEIAVRVQQAHDQAVLLGWLRVVGTGTAEEVAEALRKDGDQGVLST